MNSPNFIAGAPLLEASTFDSPRGRGQASKVLLFLNIVLDALIILLSLFTVLREGQTAQNSDSLTPVELATLFLGGGQIFLVIGTLIVFLMWVHRANKNLSALGVMGKEYTPGGAVGNFFFPILNLVRVPAILTEIWKGSDPEYIENGLNWKNRPVSGLIGAWWGCWIIRSILARISLGLTRGESPNFTASAIADIASSVFSIVAAILAIKMIDTIVNFQDEKRARRIAAGIDNGPSPFPSQEPPIPDPFSYPQPAPIPFATEITPTNQTPFSDTPPSP